MLRLPSIGFALVSLIALLTTPAHADDPQWSQKATAFMAGCFSGEWKDCKPMKIPSPDGQAFVQVSYETNPLDRTIEMADLGVVRSGRTIGTVDVVGSVEDEIAWAPNSKALFISGNNNANSDYHFAVYRVSDVSVEPIDGVAQPALQDMVRSFPPCRARNPINDCADLAKQPDDYIGTAAIDWLPDSSGIVIVAEVTCSSMMGGIMCQSLGYEIGIPSGNILRRMEPREFAKRWQHSMAWKFEIPAPPEFADKKSKR
ncbi:MAG TPA: hypothetical protein VJR23_14550 [Candidatus Acidoferrales bacterium]|nr:hypothetical protein [Candidatus Acidoferrales bacterium]